MFKTVYTVIDPTEAIQASRSNNSSNSVTTARYIVEFVMNEEHHELSDQDLRVMLAEALDNASEDGYFSNGRYDCMEFAVIDREVLDTAPAGCP